MFPWGGLVRFESFDGTVSVPFSQRGAEWSTQQAVRATAQPVFGADYGHDPWGTLSAPVASGSERWRALVANADIDAARSTLQRIGRGKLVLRLHDDSERWAWARVLATPEM